VDVCVGVCMCVVVCECAQTLNPESVLQVVFLRGYVFGCVWVDGWVGRCVCLGWWVGG